MCAHYGSSGNAPRFWPGAVKIPRRFGGADHIVAPLDYEARNVADTIDVVQDPGFPFEPTIVNKEMICARTQPL